jgi:hypothetical protein
MSQQGQTIILVAISLVSLLAMAALAIDVVTLYVARSEIQRAADAAALAGAKAIADSGITTLLLTDTDFTKVQPWALIAEDKEVKNVLQNNLVGGTAVTLDSDGVDWARQGNPLVTVTVESSALPTFFSKIWGQSPPIVKASATAEVYNPANVQNFTPIAPKGVKPWLVANADPITSGGVNPAPKFIDPSTGDIEAGATVVGEEFYLHSDCDPLIVSGCSLLDNPPAIPGSWNAAHPQVDYVPALVTPNTGWNVCPACAGATDYEQSIACADVTTSYQVLSCGGGSTNLQWDSTVIPGGLTGPSALGAECLIHATTHGNNKGQDQLENLGPWPNSPMRILAQSGPQNGSLVTTSSSVVTIPIVDTCNNVHNCFPPATGNVTIDGYMQAFIEEVRGGGAPGDIKVRVLNIAGCSSSSTNSGVTPVVGGSGSSPIPVRLITPP